ncbi:hypothetical protein BDZ89DRAFT_1166419 [Hymenopellis radicata]|nr:hypothetical protein BDZ89DRAFT_1166419 [Hymenopellis radicata]
MSPGQRCEGYRCKEQGTKMCSACKKVWYCSKRCQTEAWDLHIFQCTVPIHTAHFLKKACRDNLFPTDHQTRIDYGFERAGKSQSKLLGLYKELWIMEPSLVAREVHRWQKNGILVQKIKETFATAALEGKFTTGEYFLWFLAHEWIFDDRPIPEEDRSERLIENLGAKVWAFLGKDDSKELPQWSQDRQSCFRHYSFLLWDIRPGPESPLWIPFGYCVAKNDAVEIAVIRLYIDLIHRCNFDEFCAAYESSSLFRLIEKCGLTPVPDGPLRHLSTVLSTSPRMNHSVWDLKRSVIGTDVPPVRSVVADYGFMNCRTQDDREALADVYRAAFGHKDMDEVELHQACLRGETLDYVKRFVPLKPLDERKMRKLMQNVYPLTEF